MLPSTTSPTSSPTPDEMLLYHLLEFGNGTERISGLNDELRSRLQLEINIALGRNQDLCGRELLRTTLNEVLRVFDRLALIESNLQKLDTLLENLSILELLQFEIRFLVDFIKAETMYATDIDQALRDTFDGIVWGIPHDMRRVFEREITTELRNKSMPVVYNKIVLSHGLLSNCFQQTFITLLQTANPDLDPLQLFNGFEERLRQTLQLCKDLSVLVRVVKHAHADPTSEAIQEVLEKAIEFRDGSMQYLMYRDWRGYEHHAMELITAIDSNQDPLDLLHQFGCYLEILYGQVKMRAVLRDILEDSTDMND